MYIQVRVLTKQKKEHVKELKDGYFKVSIREKAERNEANNRILKIFKDYYNTDKVKIINGHKNPKKLISVY